MADDALPQRLLDEARDVIDAARMEWRLTLEPIIRSGLPPFEMPATATILIEHVARALLKAERRRKKS